MINVGKVIELICLCLKGWFILWGSDVGSLKYIIRGTICLKLLYSGSIVAKIKVNEKGGERLCDIVIRKLNKK